jgi:hypothetical protein
MLDLSDAGRRPGDPLGIFLLVFPFHLAIERYPPLTDGHFHRVARDGRVPLQRPSRRRGDVGVGALGLEGQPHLDVVGDRLDARRAERGIFGRPLLGVRIDPAGERDDAVLDGDADLDGLDARLLLQLFQHVTLDLFVGPRHR